MEPYNRPYVDPETEPGDKGTEEWADETPEQAAKSAEHRAPIEERQGSTDEEGTLTGSPADVFDDGDAIEARNE
jgi:hypothetical protein